MDAKKEYYKAQANSILAKCKLRGMQGHYSETKEDALEYIKSILTPNASITWGGSETIKEIGLMDYLFNNASTYNLYDRTTAKTKEEQRAFYGKAVTADYFLMSTNAITLDGELVNIDGNGNRIACLVTGPEHVIIVAGMNKVVPDIKAGIARVHNVAAPPNAIRLDRDTPCHEFGRCGNCLKPDCMCSNTVITRKSNKPDRLHVILVGEELGY